MELARSPGARVSEPPSGDSWYSAGKEIRSCGDTLTLYLREREGRISEARYSGAACALALASAELLCRTLEGLTESEASTLINEWHAYLTGEGDLPPEEPSSLESLSIVREYPARRGCVLLAFDCARTALDT